MVLSRLSWNRLRICRLGEMRGTGADCCWTDSLSSFRSISALLRSGRHQHILVKPGSHAGGEQPTPPSAQVSRALIIMSVSLYTQPQHHPAAQRKPYAHGGGEQRETRGRLTSPVKQWIEYRKCLSQLPVPFVGLSCTEKAANHLIQLQLIGGKHLPGESLETARGMVPQECTHTENVPPVSRGLTFIPSLSWLRTEQQR